MLSTFTTNINNFLDLHIPSETRHKWRQILTKFYTERPYLATFILSQLVLCLVPIILMTATVFISALSTATFFATLGTCLFVASAMGLTFLFLTPIVLFSSGVAICVWFWCVVAFVVVKWFQKRNGAKGKGDIQIVSLRAEDIKEAFGGGFRDAAVDIRNALTPNGPPQHVNGDASGPPYGPIPTNRTRPTQSSPSNTNHQQQTPEFEATIESTRHPRSPSSDDPPSKDITWPSSPNSKPSAADSADNQTERRNAHVLLSEPV